LASLDLKRWGAITALCATLFGGLGTAGGWYSAKVEEETMREVEQAQIEKRLDDVEKTLDRQREAINKQARSTVRSEIMLRQLLSHEGLPVPDTSYVDDVLVPE
jgi:hypothetical protein